MAVAICERCGSPFRPRLFLQPLCDDCLWDLRKARSQGVERCVEEMVCVRCEHELDCECGCRCLCHEFV
jgi:hypothetical protein